MPRSVRLDAAGVLHHVIIRGIERRRIFRDDRDRENFLARLGRLLSESGTRCYAWALLPNHAHLLLRTGRVPLASLMARLLTGYAVNFNHRYHRHGQLFQNRYKSIICQEDPYLLELVRYIHLNPLRAHLVADMDELGTFPYSGHSAIIGKHRRDWQDVASVLSRFGSPRQYTRFIGAGVRAGNRPELAGGGLVRSLGGWDEVRKVRSGHDRVKSDTRILGDSAFVTEVLARAEQRLKRNYQLKARRYGFDYLEQRILVLFDVTLDDLYAKSRKADLVKARSVFCFWANEELKMSATELARRLGVTQPAISYAIARGRAIAREGGYRYAGQRTLGDAL